MTYWTLGCVQKCDLWAWLRKEKRTETFMRQTGYLPRRPTSTWAPEILRAGSCPGISYIFQVSWKSVQGSRSCGGRKSPSPILQGPWLIQQLVLPYKPSLARLATSTACSGTSAARHLSRDTSITCGASHASKRQIVVIQSQNSPNFKKLQIIQDCSDMNMLLPTAS